MNLPFKKIDEQCFSKTFAACIVCFFVFLPGIKVAHAQENFNSPTAESTVADVSIPKNFSALKNFFTKDSSDKKYKKFKVDFGGMMQVHYLTEFNTNGDSLLDPDGFRILRARIQAKGYIYKWVSFELMYDVRAPEQNGILRDAFVAFHFFPHQELRFGQQKTQFGYEGRQSIQELYVVNRTDMSDNLSRGYNLRDIGLGLIGKIPLNNEWSIQDAITFTNGSKFNVTGPQQFSRTHNGWGRLGIRYKKSDLQFDAGTSAGKGVIPDFGLDPLDPADDTHTYFKRLGFDAEAEQKWFSLAAEYALGTDLLNDTISDRFGYYFTLALKSPWKVGPLVRYDQTDDEFHRWTAGAYYGNPKDKFRVLINYEFRKKILDVPEGHDDRFYVQAQVSF